MTIMGPTTADMRRKTCACFYTSMAEHEMKRLLSGKVETRITRRTKRSYESSRKWWQNKGSKSPSITKMHRRRLASVDTSQESRRRRCRSHAPSWSGVPRNRAVLHQNRLALHPSPRLGEKLTRTRASINTEHEAGRQTSHHTGVTYTKDECPNDLSKPFCRRLSGSTRRRASSRAKEAPPV